MCRDGLQSKNHDVMILRYARCAKPVRSLRELVQMTDSIDLNDALGDCGLP